MIAYRFSLLYLSVHKKLHWFMCLGDQISVKSPANVYIHIVTQTEDAERT